MLEETLELLVQDEAASETERMHAKRLLKKLKSVKRDDVKKCIKRYVSSSVEDKSQLFARIARWIDGLPVVLGHDEDWFVYGWPEFVEAVCSLIEQDESEFDELMADKQKIAYHNLSFKHMFSAGLVIRDSDVDAQLKSSYGDYDDRAPIMSKIYKRDARKAEKRWNSLHEFTKSEE